MTFKGAFQSFQTVLVPCTDTSGRSWVRGRPASPAAPAPPPQRCGVQQLAAQALPTTVDLLSWSLVPSHPNLPLENPWISLFCWAAPAREGLFLWPWPGSSQSPGVWVLLGLCVQKAASAPPTYYCSTWSRVQAEERPREWWQGESQGAELPGTPSPASGVPQCIQLLPVPPGPP